ncbi:MAG: hypothetical protein AAF334_07375 [Pseudomonadota bacterium]
MRIVPLVILATLLAAFEPRPAEACGAESRCEVEGGYYLAAVPDDWDRESPLAVVVYFHGWNGSPEGTFRNRAMVNGVNRRGALFVAPYARTGYWRQIGDGRAEGGRDERAFIRTVMDDIARRWPVDPAATLSSGFSRGASMSWNVACFAGDLFAGHAPIAGGFWNSTPRTCPTGPVNLRHIHGLADGVVAYDAVGVYNSMPIPEGMAMLRGLDGHEAEPDHEYDTDRFRCYRWTRSASGRVLETCLHAKGHSIPAEWVAEGLDWLLSLPQAVRQPQS